jgi:hypothetical protein
MDLDTALLRRFPVFDGVKLADELLAGMDGLHQLGSLPAKNPGPS